MPYSIRQSGQKSAEDLVDLYFTKSKKELKKIGGLYEYVKSPFTTKLPTISAKSLKLPKPSSQLPEDLLIYYWRKNYDQMFVSINNGLYKEPRYQGKYNSHQVEVDKSMIPIERIIFTYL